MSTYKDLNLTLQQHPNTGDILVRQNVDAVKTAMKNIIFGVAYDIPFDPNSGGNLRKTLFETFSPSTFAVTKRRIMLALSEHEPRAIIEDIYVGQSQNQNELQVGILFYVSGNPQKQTLNYTLSRVR